MSDMDARIRRRLGIHPPQLEQPEPEMDELEEPAADDSADPPAAPVSMNELIRGRLHGKTESAKENR